MPKGKRGGGINLDKKEDSCLQTWKESCILLKLEGSREFKSDSLYLSSQVKGKFLQWKLGVAGVHDMDLFPGGNIWRNVSRMNEKMNAEEGKEK